MSPNESLRARRPRSSASLGFHLRDARTAKLLELEELEQLIDVVNLRDLGVVGRLRDSVVIALSHAIERGTCDAAGSCADASALFTERFAITGSTVLLRSLSRSREADCVEPYREIPIICFGIDVARRE